MKTFSAAFFLFTSFFSSCENGQTPQSIQTSFSTCESVSAEEDLHLFLTDNEGCFSLAANAVYEVTETTYLSGITEIRGNGATISAANWTMLPGEDPINTIFSMRFATSAVLSDLTMDGANLAVYGIMGRDFTLNNVTIINGACSAIGIANTGVIVDNSTFLHNGWNCTVYSGLEYGGAVYAEFQTSHSSNCYAPIITNSTIADSYGPALDINRVSCGILIGNTIYDNIGPAAVSLYESSNWLLSNNTIYHAFSDDNVDTQFHPYCTATNGPIGPKVAAVKICQDTNEFLATNNVVENNSIASSYGILILGADEISTSTIPRNNTVRNNNMFGSIVACADDLKWPTRIMRLTLSLALQNAKGLNLNLWQNNNCGNLKGLPNFF